ncbi:type II toxin-antitoxin system VapC family toxin [Leucothrix mucor]|uniref:type II toxin-antitoxin system VapC family toxin n=1 Tax=Leucothrix mucor TaxID=45248 RepID=UPI0003B69891|nr:type II toxin-antitoxin system VapC family toxin [Leucothrix mucor]
MYLLDTNIVSEIRKIGRNKADKNVVAWLSNVSKESFYTNAVVVMEIERGILRMSRKDQQQAASLKDWYQTVVKSMFHERVLPIDEATANICATLHIPDLAPENDAWIASSAIQYDLTLVTRNTKDFQHPNLRVLNPFEV